MIPEIVTLYFGLLKSSCNKKYYHVKCYNQKFLHVEKTSRAELFSPFRTRSTNFSLQLYINIDVDLKNFVNTKSNKIDCFIFSTCSEWERAHRRAVWATAAWVKVSTGEPVVGPEMDHLEAAYEDNLGPDQGHDVNELFVSETRDCKPVRRSRD